MDIKNLTTDIEPLPDYIDNAFYPRVPEISLELTNKCNLKCPYCGNANLTREEGFISWDLLNKLVDECADGKFNIAHLHGTGEPLLWDRLEEAIVLIKSRNAGDASFGTNGTILSKKRVKSLLDAGLEKLYISVDTLDPEIYKQTRGGKLSKVINNIKGAIETAPKDFEITIALMEHKDQSISTPLYLSFFREFGMHPNVTLNLIQNTLFPSSSDDYRVNQKKQENCLLPKNYFTIAIDGRVSLCCVDQDVLYSMGDTNTQTIEEIWYSEKNQETFRKIASGAPGCPDVCTKKCVIKETTVEPVILPEALMPFTQAIKNAQESFLSGDIARAKSILGVLNIRNHASKEVQHLTRVLNVIN